MANLLRRLTTLKSYANPSVLLRARSKFSSEPFTTIIGRGQHVLDSPSGERKRESFVSHGDRLQLSPLFFESSKTHLEDCKIELVDSEAWQVSSGLADMWKGNDEVALEAKPVFSEGEGDNYDWPVNYVPPNKQDPDVDEIEDMRVRGILFYKLDKHSREYKEYKFDFHRRKSSKNQNGQNENTEKKKKKQRASAFRNEKDTKSKKDHKEIVREKSHHDSRIDVGKDNSFKEGDKKGVEKNELLIPGIHVGGNLGRKNLRTPTFNQLTAPYHEPFCLDIYVSKGSVRASIIHRATSKVVAVAHSISKDMKFDLRSTKSRSTCAAVGKVLAERALADDIHNVVYTPRKGEVLEGKLQIVLQSVIDQGIDVKVKIKQRKGKKSSLFQQKLNSNVDGDRV